MYAPFGAGVLIGRPSWLAMAPPYLAGGGAVRNVTLSSTSWQDLPARHEAGTPNLIGAVALAAACREVGALSPGAVLAHEASLLCLLDSGLESVDARVLRLWPSDSCDRVPVVTFSMEGFPAPLVAAVLSAEWGIGVRDGRFCAHPLLARLGAPDGAVRVSLGLGSRSDDISRLVTALHQLRDAGPKWTYSADHHPDPDPRPLPSWAVLAQWPGGAGGRGAVTGAGAVQQPS
jgi:selenocysteine lyase/cysteine desulfurase